MSAPKIDNPPLSQSIILIGQNWFQVIDHVDENAVPAKVPKITWEASNLESKLIKAAQGLENKAVRIILADNLAIVVPVVLSQDESDVEDKVFEHVGKTITQPLEKLGLDWEKVAEIEDKTVYQVFAVQKPLLTLIGNAASTADLSVEVVEPLSYCLARQVKAQTRPKLVIYGSDYITLVVAYQQAVLASTVISSQNVYNAAKTLLSFIHQKLDLEVKSIIMASKSDKASPDKLSDLDLTFQEADLNPLSDHSTSKSLFGNNPQPEKEGKKVFDLEESSSASEQEDTSDEATSPLDTDSLAESEEPDLDISHKAPKLPLRVAHTDSEEDMDKPIASESSGKPKAKFIITIIAVVAVLTGIAVGGVIIYQNAVTSKPTTSPTPTDLPTEVTPSPAAESTSSAQTETDQPVETGEFDPAEISVQILNGSGVPGAAGKVADLIKAADFTDIKTGNASAYDYKETEISVKAGQSALLKALSTAISDSYTVGATDDQLDADSSYDAVIIVGQE